METKDISKSFLGDDLPVGRAAFQNANFEAALRHNPDLLRFPVAVCYTITELRDFLNKAEHSLNNDKVPADQQGVACMLGISHDVNNHSKDKVSIMLVSTAFAEDKANRKVTFINNPVIVSGPKQGEELLSVSDKSYDSGSLWP